MSPRLQSTPSYRSAGRRAAVLGSLAVTCLVPGASRAMAEPGPRLGDLVVIAGEGSAEALSGGGSATEFSLRLPKDASCPGDSAHDGFRVQSFIVPSADDPGTLRYRSIGPEGTGRYALYNVFTSPYVQAQTAEADSPGHPGRVVNVPTFSFAVFPRGELSDGPHRIGVACTLFNDTVGYWETGIELRSAADDRPAGFRWTVTTARAARPDGSRLPVTAGLVAATGAGALVAGIGRRRSRRSLVRSSGTR